MASRTLEVKKGSKLHEKLVTRLTNRVRLAEQGHGEQHDKWERAEEITLAYVNTSDVDRARDQKRRKGTPSYTTIQIPYTFSVLMSAHTYWTSVFFARAPIHQFSGRHGEGEMQIQAMEALIAYQVEVSNMVVPYFLWLYDTGKYGCGIMGHYWEQKKLHYGQLVEMADPMTGETKLWQTTNELIGYTGNCAYNISPWDFMSDPRVAFKDFQKGEFCCVFKRMQWNDILRRKDEGYFNSNIDELKDHEAKSGIADGSSQLRRPDFNLKFQDDEIAQTEHPAVGHFWEVYVDLVPDEWGVGTTKYPQKWCFTITEDLGLIVGASPLGYMHCQFPFDVMEAEVEGYGCYARGMPEIMEPIQNTVDWLINTHFFNVRAALNNQFIVDPSKLVIKDVQNSGPGFIWRLRPEAYGTDINTMFKQVDIKDITRAHMSDFQAMLGIGERTLGVNDQIMGSLNTGSARKTATEVRTTTGFGVNRLKTVSEYMSAMGFQPHAQKLVQSSQQFYTGDQKMRRVGSFAQEAGMNFINVTPESIVGQFDVVPVDGTLPIDRMAQANLWKELMAGIRMMPPQVAMSYDWSRIFAWVSQLAGLNNINQFKVQVVPDGSMAGQVQAGNVIPMPPRPALGGGASGAAPGNAASTQSGLNALQGESSVSGTGPGY
jgi:hypothetical protein